MQIPGNNFQKQTPLNIIQNPWNYFKVLPPNYFEGGSTGHLTSKPPLLVHWLLPFSRLLTPWFVVSQYNLTRQHSFEIISYIYTSSGQKKTPIRPSPLGNSRKMVFNNYLHHWFFLHITYFQFFILLPISLIFPPCPIKKDSGNEWERASIRFLWVFDFFPSLCRASPIPLK